METNSEQQTEIERRELERVEELRARIVERDRIIRALNEALKRDLDELFQHEQAA